MIESVEICMYRIGAHHVRTSAKDAMCRLGDERRSLSPEQQTQAQPPTMLAMACDAASTAAAAMPSL
jgi:hypothetical protein